MHIDLLQSVVKTLKYGGAYGLFFLLLNKKLIDLFWEIVIHVQNLFAYMLLCKVLHMK